EGKAGEFRDYVKSGRTHLMDAVPVTLGQEFGGYAAAIRKDLARVSGVLPQAGELPLGGTAVGTGLNAPAGFAAARIARLAAHGAGRGPRPRTTSRRPGPGTGWSRPAECCAPPQCRSTRSATTCA